MLTSKPSKIHSRRVANPPTHRLKRRLGPSLPTAGDVAHSTHCAPATRPIRGSVLNPIRPRNRQPWVPILDNKGKVIGERILPGRARKGSGS